MHHSDPGVFLAEEAKTQDGKHLLSTEDTLLRVGIFPETAVTLTLMCIGMIRTAC